MEFHISITGMASIKYNFIISRPSFYEVIKFELLEIKFLKLNFLKIIYPKNK